MNDSSLIDLLRAGMDQEGARGWDVWLDELWCHVRPPRYQERDQGWKLHVSATRASAGAVLTRAVGVLTASGCAFKFAKSREQAGILNSTHYHRGGAGKFLTAYPDDDDHFRRLAAELDAVTAGLAGPAILSDRPYRPGSLVHYRYGAFAGTAVLTNDGYYRPMIIGPGGALVEDRRDAWFNPPAGVVPPVGEDAETPATGPSRPRSVLLGDRFIVREAIRHANKGGVYRATDTATDADVIVKEARPHVQADEHGRDVRDALRHEAEMLLLLLPLRITPRPIRLLEQGG
ncbi:MAG: class IV lanthionine synthetase LanL, partial [Pseudonocardiaceae bacterium]